MIDTLVVFVGYLDGQPSGSFVGSSLAFVTRINPLLIADSYRVDLVRLTWSCWLCCQTHHRHCCVWGFDVISECVIVTSDPLVGGIKWQEVVWYLCSTQHGLFNVVGICSHLSDPGHLWSKASTYSGVSCITWLSEQRCGWLGLQDWLALDSWLSDPGIAPNRSPPCGYTSEESRLSA